MKFLEWGQATFDNIKERAAALPQTDEGADVKRLLMVAAKAIDDAMELVDAQQEAREK